MRKRKAKKPQTLTDAKKYYKFLLYEATSGNMGSKPDIAIKNEGMTFAEKRGLLDSIIKISQLEVKSQENDEPESGFDLIRRGLQDDRRDGGSAGDNGGTEGDPDEIGSSEDPSDIA